jgi:serine/threonine-protein kinase HipA
LKKATPASASPPAPACFACWDCKAISIDHLRNHGFILTADGWGLAPAYDLNPNIERSHHQLAIDSSDPTPDVALALATAKFYDLTAAQAGEILQRVRAAVGQWQAIATNHRLPRAEMELVAQAFRTAL